MNIRALRLALNEMECGCIVAAERGVFMAAFASYAGESDPDAYLVQIHSDGTFDVNGDPAEGGQIPEEYRERVTALLGEEKQ